MRMENRQDRLNSPGPMAQPGHTHESNRLLALRIAVLDWPKKILLDWILLWSIICCLS